MENIGKIIQNFRKKKGVRQELLAKKLGITVQSLSRIENSKGKMHVERVEKICKLLNVPMMDFWRATVDDGTNQANPGELQIMGYANDPTNQHRITWSTRGLPVSPAVGTVVAGTGLPGKNCYALVVRDNSMDPIETGWVVVVDPDGEIQNRDHVIVEKNGFVLLRRIIINDRDSFTLNVSKGFQEPMTLRREEVKILHKVWCFISR